MPDVGWQVVPRYAGFGSFPERSCRRQAHESQLARPFFVYLGGTPLPYSVHFGLPSEGRMPAGAFFLRARALSIPLMPT
jgi:hypothetical protein